MLESLFDKVAGPQDCSSIKRQGDPPTPVFSSEICETQKQPFRGVLSKRCSENMQQIYRKTPMQKILKFPCTFGFCYLLPTTIKREERHQMSKCAFHHVIITQEIKLYHSVKNKRHRILQKLCKCFWFLFFKPCLINSTTLLSESLDFTFFSKKSSDRVRVFFGFFSVAAIKNY